MKDNISVKMNIFHMFSYKSLASDALISEISHWTFVTYMYVIKICSRIILKYIEIHIEINSVTFIQDNKINVTV